MDCYWVNLAAKCLVLWFAAWALTIVGGMGLIVVHRVLVLAKRRRK